MSQVSHIDIQALPADCVFFIHETVVDIPGWKDDQRRSRLVMGKRDGEGFMELHQWHEKKLRRKRMREA